MLGVFKTKQKSHAEYPDNKLQWAPPLPIKVFFAFCVSGGDETERRDRALKAEEDHDASRERRESEVCAPSSPLGNFKKEEVGHFCHPSGQTRCCAMFLKWHYEPQKLKQQRRIHLSSRFILRVRPHLHLCTFCKEEIYTPSSPLSPIGSGPTCMLGGGAVRHGNVWVCNQSQLHAVAAASQAKIKTNPVDKSKSQLNKNHT